MQHDIRKGPRMETYKLKPKILTFKDNKKKIPVTQKTLGTFIGWPAYQ